MDPRHLPEKAIKEGGLRPALPGLLALAILASSYFLPIAGTFFLPLLPAPLAYARLRYGTGNFVFASALCMLLVSTTGGFPAVSAVVLMFCIAAFALGGSLNKGDPDDRAVLKGALLPVIIVGPLVGLYFLAAGVDPWSLMARALGEGLDESVELYRSMGMSQADIDKVLPSLRLFVRLVVDYLPAVCIVSMSITSFVSWFFLKLHAARAGVTGAPDVPMDRWYAPDHAVWGVIIPGFLMIPPVPELRQAAGNLLIVFAMVYLFQGVAVTSHFFGRLKLPSLLKALGAFLIAVQPFLLLAMWAVGLFDTWADFRKVRPKQEKLR